MSKIAYLRKRGNDHFEIIWSDGQKQVFYFSTLQIHCPCCRCASQDKSKKITKEVRVLKVEVVGSYGIKILFNKGCSLGIYPFSLLKEIGK